MENEIDLTKISVKETASKKIQANLDGTIKDYTIYALNDSHKFSIMTLMGSDDPDKYLKIQKALFSYGLGFSSRVTDIVFASESVMEAIRIADEVYKFSDLFDRQKIKELEEAEKNSVKQDPVLEATAN